MSRASPPGLVALVAALVVGGCGAATARAPVDVVGGLTDGAGNELVVYRPVRAREAPVAVLLHGCCGDHTDMGQLAWALAHTGVVAVTASWTTAADGGGWPRSYGDAGCAVAWARQHSSAHGGDPDTVLLVAWSDAGLLAAVAGVGAAPPRPGCASDRTQPDGVVGLAAYFGTGLAARPRLTEEQSRFLGRRGLRSPGLPEVALAGRVSAPTWLVVGRDDSLHDETLAWATTLEAAGARVTTTVERGGHGDAISPRTPLGATAVAVVRSAARELARE